MIRTFRYPLRLTTAQAIVLDYVRGKCCELYNAALEQRRSAYRTQRKSLSRYDQHRDLTELRAADPEYGSLAVVILRSSLHRVDNAFKGFFRRVRSGQTPGFPRFRSRERYDSFSFPNPVVEGNTVLIPKLGSVRFHRYRELRGNVKEAVIRREAGGWTVSFVCDLGPAPAKVVPTEDKTVGIDVGILALATLSDGLPVANPRLLNRSAQKIAERQRSLARKRKGSRSRARARQLLARQYRRLANQRLDLARKTAKELFSKYDVVCFEDLKISNLVRSGKAGPKSILDAAWRQLTVCLLNKAEEAGKHAIAVNPHNTSQLCSRCGVLVPKDLSERRHRCACGLDIDRDVNAALNIKALGWSVVKDLAAKAA